MMTKPNHNAPMHKPEDYELWPVEDIVVEDRHRHDLEIETMVGWITEAGDILQPIGITPDGRLCWGERRLLAAKQLGYTHIKVLVRERDDLVEQVAENRGRKDYAPSELVAIGRKLEARYAEEAAERRRGGGQLPEGQNGGATRDLVARDLGTSGKTYERAKAVIAAAEADPDRFGHLVDQMDRTGKVNAPYQKVMKARDEDRVHGLKPVEGKFRTLILDCPWKFDWLSETGQAAPGYAMMTLEEIEDIDPLRWADDEFCHLYMWSPNNFVGEAWRILTQVWGFDYRTIITWKKPNIGMGHYFRNDTEQILFGTRGKKTTRVDNLPTWFEGRPGVDGQHSSKPEEFYEIVRTASYGPIGEAFGRKQREGITELYEKIVKEGETTDA